MLIRKITQVVLPIILISIFMNCSDEIESPPIVMEDPEEPTVPCLLPGIDCPAPEDTLNLPAVNPSTPNIVIFYTDDQGFGDVNAFGGGNVLTPNLDQLANEGMVFTNFYSASSVCTPARAGLLTGTYPPRVGINGVYNPRSTAGLKSSETTIADIAKSAGYNTALIGKWHLGHLDQFLPLNHGFDEFFGLPYSNDMWPRDWKGDPVTDPSNNRINNPPLRVIDGFTPLDTIDNLTDQGLLTLRFTERAIDYIDRNKSNPFLMVLSHPMPHVPLAVSPEFKDTTGLGIYADVIFEVDWSIGQVLKKLRDEGLEGNTLVVFATDNGPWLRYGTHGGSNGGLREGKTTLFDGGFKVPCIMKWPGKIPSGSVYKEMASAIDLLPSIAEITGVSLPEQPIDGVSMNQVIWHGVLDRPYRREYYFYRNGDLLALRLNDTKLLFGHDYQPEALMTKFNDGRFGRSQNVPYDGGLFDLANDIRETSNLLNTSDDRLLNIFRAKADSVRQILGSRADGITGSEVR